MGRLPKFADAKPKKKKNVTAATREMRKELMRKINEKKRNEKAGVVEKADTTETQEANNPPSHTESTSTEIAADLQQNIAAQQELAESLKMDMPPGYKDDTVIMEVPRVEDVTSFREEPVVEKHAVNNDSGAGGGQQPPPDPNFVFGDEARQQQQPFDANGPQPNQAMPTQSPQQAAEQTFAALCSGYNYLIQQHVPGLVKAKKPQSFDKVPVHIQNEIKIRLDRDAIEKSKFLVLTEEEIALMRDPAIAVIQETGSAFGNKELLIFAVVQVFGTKMKIFVMALMDKKNVTAAIEQSLQQHLGEVKKETDKSEQFYHKTKDMMSAMEKMTEQINTTMKNGVQSEKAAA